MRRHCGPKCENMGSVIDWKEVFQGMLETFFGDRNVLYVGTSRVVQWLKLCLPMQRARVLSLVGKLRAHKLLDVAKFFFLKNSECVMGGEEHPLFHLQKYSLCCIVQWWQCIQLQKPTETAHLRSVYLLLLIKTKFSRFLTFPPFMVYSKENEILGLYT